MMLLSMKQSPCQRQLLIIVEPALLPSMAVMVPLQHLVLPVPQLAGLRLSRLTHPLQVMPAWALRPLMQNQLARHQYRL